MLLEICLLNTPIVTELAFSRLFTCVCIPVLLQLLAEPKGALANITHIILFPSVNSHVLFQKAFCGKLHLTDVTLEGLLLNVHANYVSL